MPRRTDAAPADAHLRAGVLALLPLAADSPEVAPLVDACREVLLLALQAMIHGHGQVVVTIREGQIDTVEGTTSRRVKVRRDPIPLRRPS